MCFAIGKRVIRSAIFCIPADVTLDQPSAVNEISGLFNKLTSWFGSTPGINKDQFALLVTSYKKLKENSAELSVSRFKLGTYDGVTMSYADGAISGEYQDQVYCIFRVNDIDHLLQNISKCCDKYRSSILDKHSESAMANYLMNLYNLRSNAQLLARLHSLPRDSTALLSRSSGDSIEDFKDSVSGKIDNSEIIPLLNSLHADIFNSIANKYLELYIVQYFTYNQEAVIELASIGIFDSINNSGDTGRNPVIDQLRSNGYKKQADLALLYTTQYFMARYDNNILISFEILSRQRKNSTKNLETVIEVDILRTVGINTNAIILTINDKDIPLGMIRPHNIHLHKQPPTYKQIYDSLYDSQTFLTFLQDQGMVEHTHKIIHMIIFAVNQENFTDCHFPDALKVRLVINEYGLKRKISFEPAANKIIFWQSYNLELNSCVTNIETSHHICVTDEINADGDSFMQKRDIDLIGVMKIDSIKINQVEYYAVSAQKIAAAP